MENPRDENLKKVAEDMIAKVMEKYLFYYNSQETREAIIEECNRFLESALKEAKFKRG